MCTFQFHRECHELLQHPVVRSFLFWEWTSFGFWIYLVTMSIYGLFLLFLTLFSVMVNNPLSEVCKCCSIYIEYTFHAGLSDDVIEGSN